MSFRQKKNLLILMNSDSITEVINMLTHLKAEFSYTNCITSAKATLLQGPHILTVVDGHHIENLHSFINEIQNDNRYLIDIMLVQDNTHPIQLDSGKTPIIYWPNNNRALYAKLKQRFSTKSSHRERISFDILPTAPTYSVEQQLLHRFKKCVSHRYQDKNLTIEILASASCLSPRPLQRKIKQLLQCTPMAYLRKYRVEIAKSLLLHEKLSIAEISIKTGFSTPNYFAQVFKRETGITPREFQQNDCAT